MVWWYLQFCCTQYKTKRWMMHRRLFVFQFFHAKMNDLSKVNLLCRVMCDQDSLNFKLKCMKNVDCRIRYVNSFGGQPIIYLQNCLRPYIFSRVILKTSGYHVTDDIKSSAPSHSVWKSFKKKTSGFKNQHLIGQKFIGNAKIVNFGKSVACGQTVLPDRSILNWTKVDGKCQ